MGLESRSYQDAPSPRVLKKAENLPPLERDWKDFQGFTPNLAGKKGSSVELPGTMTEPDFAAEQPLLGHCNLDIFHKPGLSLLKLLPQLHQLVFIHAFAHRFKDF